VEWPDTNNKTWNSAEIRRNVQCMKGLLAGVFVIVVSVVGAMAQTLQEPTLTFSQLPTYPPLAKQARIEGSVKLTFVVNESGEVTDVQVASGHPMLKPAAVTVVQMWRFAMPRDLYRTEWRYETEFVYRLSGKEVERNPKLTISLDSFHRIEISSDVVKGTIQYMCSHEPCPQQR
jgi:TonB family protein